MQKKIEEHQFMGMLRDTSISKQKPEYLWDAHNIRLTARHGDTLLSLTNERGTKRISSVSLDGVVLGYCVLGEYLTIFTTNLITDTKPDTIYRVKKNGNTFDIDVLYNGNLNFNVNHPIECLGVYENVEIQKVYWTDGINQPRFINITKNLVDGKYNDTSFDFIPTLSLKDSIHVKKVADSSGLFPAGVIQYAVTYYNKYGQESNISVVSSLIPTSYTLRAGSPEETIGNAFRVTIKHPDTQFEFLRLYSIFRSSKDTTPVCKRVVDVRLGYGNTTTKKIYTSDDVHTLQYARIDLATAEFKLTPNEDFKPLNDTNASIYKENESVTVNNITFTANRYYHFNKDSHPYVIIRAKLLNNETSQFEENYTCITWDANTDLYISVDNIQGPGAAICSLVQPGRDIFKMKAASNIYYSRTEFLKSGDIVITDNNTIGEDIDYNELLFVGGEKITAGTMTQKDGTLFLGDITISRPLIIGDYNKSISEIDQLPNTYITSELSKGEGEANVINAIRKGATVSCTTRQCKIPLTMNSLSYKWGNTLNAQLYLGYDPEEDITIAGFKWGDHYRLGLQFQYETGKWSQPVYIKDMTMLDNNGVSNRPDLTIPANTNYYIQKIPAFQIMLDQRVGDYMLSKGYKRVRAVVCFPTESDQLILCQGLLNPTVHSIAGRLNHTPDVLSSWFFRPVPKTGDTSINGGGIPQYKRGYTLHSGEYGTVTINETNYSTVYPTRHGEIQGVPTELSNVFASNAQINNISYDLYHLSSSSSVPINMNIPRKGSNDDDDLKFNISDSLELNNIFVVDWSYLTFHSPEFEFNDSFHNMDTSTLKCQMIGKYLLESNQGDIHVMTSTTVMDTDAPGFYHRVVASQLSASRINAGLFYKDCIICTITGSDESDEYIPYKVLDKSITWSYLVYPWHRTGSLNNDSVRIEKDGIKMLRTAMLSQKKMSNIMYFNNISFDNSPTNLDYSLNQSSDIKVDIKTFDSDLISLVKINDMNYFGNIDQVVNPCVKYPIAVGSSESFVNNVAYIPSTLMTLSGIVLKKGLDLSNDPVYMKYKSTPHGIIHTAYPLDLSTGNLPYLYCAEIYREALNTDFGGTSPMAIHNNLWYPAGPAIKIGYDVEEHELTDNDAGKTKIPFWYGDTYYQRYDCLKTYPFTDEDTNSIIEIGSFMVETRVNLDGRYDKNRGNILNFMLNPTVFNLINPVYSQKDNFFNYRILDEDYYALSNYPTMITWTGYKNNAAEVDNWTNITLASTLEMDGTKGKVNAVRVNSDQLYCFQNDAIGLILFNSRVQISPSDGVPIEISNNYKVDGNRYISTSIGCQNKWSIAEGTDGLYFIDDNTEALYLLGGLAQLKPISTPLNMSYWFMTQDCGTPWRQHYLTLDEEYSLQGIRCFYDSANADLYICTPETTLCYSEKLGLFVSFFDYHNVIGMFNIDSNYYALNYGISDYLDDDELPPIMLWGMFQGVYNSFFDKSYPSDFTFISNENPLNDKIFTNVEVRGDFRYWIRNEVEDDFNSPNHLVDHRRMFDTVRVWNEYQDTGDIDLRFINDRVSNMKKKFRIWRMDIPRDKDHIRQRIRNTWSKVKFTMNTLPERTLEDLIGTVTDYMFWNGTKWCNLDLRNTSTRRFSYENYYIIEEHLITHNETESQYVEYARYYMSGNIISRKLYTESSYSPYAYRKIHDMEIHDIGIVYFV